MAPSRAPLHRLISAQHLRPSPRLLSTSCRISTAQPSFHPHQLHAPALYSGRLHRQPNPSFLRPRLYSSSAAPAPPDYLNEKELHIFNKILAALEPAKLEVQDISGGCGSMYALEIESPKFKGLSIIKQHKMVNEVLKEEISGWHGVQLRTRPA